MQNNLYIQKDFSHLLGLTGFSDTVMNNHFTLYNGYVANSNKVIGLLDTVEKGGYEYCELKRRLGWEVNGIKLHEMYWTNMSKTGGDASMSENMKSIIVRNYGSIDEYKASLKRNGMIRGIGWVLLVQDRDTGNMFHTWIGEHNVGIIMNANILMVMDCWEHAYMIDYGIKRGDYIDAFINTIDWNVVESRVEKA